MAFKQKGFPMIKGSALHKDEKKKKIEHIELKGVDDAELHQFVKTKKSGKEKELVTLGHTGEGEDTKYYKWKKGTKHTVKDTYGKGRGDLIAYGEGDIIDDLHVDPEKLGGKGKEISKKKYERKLKRKKRKSAPIQN